MTASTRSGAPCHIYQGVVAALKGGYGKDPTLAHMLRCLFFLEAKFDLSLTAIRGVATIEALEAAASYKITPKPNWIHPTPIQSFATYRHLAS